MPYRFSQHAASLVRCLLVVVLLTAAAGTAAAQPLDADRTPETAPLSAFARIAEAAQDDGADDASAQALARAVSASFDQETKLTASVPGAGDQFGWSVSVSGDRALVGAPFDADAGTNSGSAYVFVRDAGTGAWTQEQKLTASDTAAGDLFGWSVSVSGDRALVGARADDTAGGGDSGSAYVFVRDAGTGVWTQQQKLTASDGAPADQFGRSVSISGDRALVGAPFDDSRGNDSGSAYVFARDAGTGAWAQEQKFSGSDIGSNDWFGFSVSISGDRALVGAPRDDEGNNDSGSAYAFSRDAGTGAWVQEQKFTLPFFSGGRFGWFVSISGDRALVGAPGAAFIGPGTGAADLFARDSGTGAWTLEARFTASDPGAGDEFGYSVSISGDHVLVGAPLDDDAGGNSGSAYAFVRDAGTGAWTQEAKLTASDAAGSDIFGFSVSISGDRALVGARVDDNSGVIDSGSAYVFEPPTVTATSSTARGWRMLSAPVPATVANLTDINLVGGVQNDPLCDSASEGEPITLLTGYTGGQTASDDGYTAPATYADALTPGDGFFWFFFDPPATTAGPCGDAGDGTASTAETLPVVLSLPGTGATTDQVVTVDGRVANDDAFYLGGNAFAEDVDLGETALDFVSATDDNGVAVPLQNQVQVYDPEAGGYVIVMPTADAGADVATDNLAVWQGAWLERTNAASPTYPLTLTYAANARTGSQDPSVFIGRLAAHGEGTVRRVRFALTGVVGPNESAVFDGAAAVVFAEGADAGWDAFDGSKLGALQAPFTLLAPVGENRSGARTQKAAESLALDAPASGAVEVPLAFYTSAAGAFEFAWPDLVGFPETWTLALHDTATGESTDLRAAETYAFEAEASADWTDRFVLRVTAPAVTNEEGAPEMFALSAVHPNPSTGGATLTLTLAEATVVRAEVFDVLGRRVTALRDEATAGGRTHRLVLPKLPAGSYLVRVTAGDRVETRRFTVVR